MHVSRLPFLCTGVTCAIFHGWGNLPSIRDLLNRKVRGTVMIGELRVRILLWIQSGPTALDGFNSFSTFFTVKSLMSISVIEECTGRTLGKGSSSPSTTD